MSNVRLVALTQPVGLEETATSEEFIAYCARVSNPGNQENNSTAPKLLNYLIKNNHWSPFEMAHAVMEIETTRDIARQILRHRSFSFQEFSQRYATVTADAVLREARLQDTKNRQNSLDTNDEGLQEWWDMAQRSVAAVTSEVYSYALSRGIAKEVARVLLPEGMTPSRLYMAGSIRSWIHYIQLRTGNGTQKEHREVASKCCGVLVSAMPSLRDIITR